MPQRVMVWPGRAAFRMELMGWSVCELKFCAMAGPLPPWFAVKMPKLDRTMLTAKLALVWPPKVTVSWAAPTGCWTE